MDFEQEQALVEELKKYARNVVGKRFLRLLKSLPTRIKRKIGVLRNDI